MVLSLPIHRYRSSYQKREYSMSSHVWAHPSKMHGCNASIDTSNVARALKFQANLPIHFWGDCALAAAHIINRTRTIANERRTPYEMLLDRPPTYDHLKVLGCPCREGTNSKQRDKFDSSWLVHLHRVSARPTWMESTKPEDLRVLCLARCDLLRAHTALYCGRGKHILDAIHEHISW